VHHEVEGNVDAGDVQAGIVNTYGFCLGIHTPTDNRFRPWVLAELPAPRLIRLKRIWT
jgi:hypothetical protein